MVTEIGPKKRPSRSEEVGLALRCKPRAERAFPAARSRVQALPNSHTKTIFVVVSFSSHPRVGSAVIDDTSLIEIWRPRVLGLLTSTCDGSQVCCEIFWC